MTAPYTPIFHVYVLRQRNGRERKHVLARYRVGAGNEQDAIAKVQHERINDGIVARKGDRIVDCVRVGDASAVIHDGAFLLTPAEVAARYPDTQEQRL